MKIGKKKSIKMLAFQFEKEFLSANFVLNGMTRIPRTILHGKIGRIH